jgi:hypothetical protein
MAGRSPKRKDINPKEKMKNRPNQKSGSDYRLAVVLGGAIILAIAIICAVLLTQPQ